MPIGFSFAPGADLDMQGGQTGNGQSRSRLSPQQAVKILSLRIPESLPANAPVSRALLTAPGGAGFQSDAALMQNLLRGARAPVTTPVQPSVGSAPSRQAPQAPPASGLDAVLRQLVAAFPEQAPSVPPLPSAPLDLPPSPAPQMPGYPQRPAPVPRGPEPPPSNIPNPPPNPPAPQVDTPPYVNAPSLLADARNDPFFGWIGDPSMLYGEGDAGSNQVEVNKWGSLFGDDFFRTPAQRRPTAGPRAPRIIVQNPPLGGGDFV